MLDNKQYRTVIPQFRGKKGPLHSPSLSVRGKVTFWDLGWRDGTQAGEAVLLNWGGRVGFLGWKSGWNLCQHTQEEGVMQKVEVQKSVSFSWAFGQELGWKCEKKKEKKKSQGLREIACYRDKTCRDTLNIVLKDTGEILVTLLIQLRSQKTQSRIQDHTLE